VFRYSCEPSGGDILRIEDKPLQCKPLLMLCTADYLSRRTAYQSLANSEFPVVYGLARKLLRPHELVAV
jgi:hypothetical protein